MRDFDIRNIIRKTLLQKYYQDNDSKVVEELDIPAAKARIDMAVINGHMHGFEIKSAQDTLIRIPSQLQAYTKVFDYVSVITENKYLTKLEKLLPEWVGIYTCTDESIIIECRKPLLNNEIQGFFLAKMLWRTELLSTLKKMEIKHRKADRNWLLCETLSQNMPANEISAIVRQNLKNRENWKLKNTIQQC